MSIGQQFQHKVQWPVGIGAIIRDDKGRVEAALSKKTYAPLGAVDA